MSAAVVVEGPAWCEPGLDLRGGRYPLSVEAPVMAMVDTPLPGVSTLTSLVRYYGLYWALADLAAERDLDVAGCQALVRRAEVAVALVSRRFDTRRQAHGVDRVNALPSPWSEPRHVMQESLLAQTFARRSGTAP